MLKLKDEDFSCVINWTWTCTCCGHENKICDDNIDECDEVECDNCNQKFVYESEL